MPKDLLRRYLPSARSVRESRALRPISKWLHNPEIWHLHRRSVSGAAFIGLFCAFLPIPFQTLVAGALALGFRCNLPLSVALVWITNPITIPPMFYFSYRLGAWLLGIQVEVDSVEISWSWLGDNLSNIGYPLLCGSLVCGWVSGLTAMVVVRLLWRVHVVRSWKERRKQRQERVARLAASPDADPQEG